MENGFKSVIDFWPSPEAMSEEVGPRVEAVRKWRQRDRIPSSWWYAIAQSETGRANGVTVESLAKLIAPVAAE